MKNKEFDDLMMDHIAGDLSTKDSDQFVFLLKSDKLNIEKYKEMAEMHAKLYVPYFESEKESNYKKLSHQLGFHNRKPLYSKKSFYLRIAATVFLCIMASGITYYVQNKMTQHKLDNLYTKTEVPLGSQVKLVLPDGTFVNLNSGSILKYNQNFGKDSRYVSLEGEGYFDVRRDDTKPFVVNTHGLNVQVLGTTFNIKSYREDSQIEVNLIEGLVDVFTSENEEDKKQLNMDECLVYDKASKSMRITKTNAARAGLWTTGKISFVNTSLIDIMKDLQRRYDVQILIQSDKMKSEFFSGSVNADFSVQEVLDFLDVDNKYTRQQKGNTITIRDK